MKDFVYKTYGIPSKACIWLRRMGLRETQWILDVEWILFSYDRAVTYREWIKEK